LPSDREILIVAAEADVGAVAITDFDGMVAGETEGASASETGADLLAGEVGDTAQAGDTAPPEILVE
jgi:predicted metal-dependent phosphoesterase TrpH